MVAPCVFEEAERTESRCRYADPRRVEPAAGSYPGPTSFLTAPTNAVGGLPCNAVLAPLPPPPLPYSRIGQSEAHIPGCGPGAVHSVQWLDLQPTRARASLSRRQYSQCIARRNTTTARSAACAGTLVDRVHAEIDSAGSGFPGPAWRLAH